MTQFIYHDAGAQEAQQMLAMSFLLAQDSPGLATDGVLSGLSVAQTTTASAAVSVAKGAGVAQSSVLLGAQMMVLDTDLTSFDVLTANPLGALPRNDLIVFDAATISGSPGAMTGGIRVVVGTPNASPTDPAVPATAVALARLRHAASATTIPAAKIDDLRVFTSLIPPIEPGWVAYSPAWAADTTNPNAGNGSVTGAYKTGRDGMVDAVIVVKMGTTGQSQGSGSYSLTLPVAASLVEPFAVDGSAIYATNGKNYVMAPSYLDGTRIRVVPNGVTGVWNQTVPDAITTGATLRIQLRYRKA